MTDLIDPKTHRMEKDPSLPMDKRNKVAQQFLIGKGSSVKGTLAEQFFKAKSFERSGCEGMADDDVHPEIIEWIVDAALDSRTKGFVGPLPQLPATGPQGQKPNVIGGALDFGKRNPADELPDFDGSVFKAVWYYTKAGGKKSYCPKDKDYFRNLYHAISVGGKPEPDDINVPASFTVNPDKTFSLDVDQLVRHRMFQITNAPIISGEPDCAEGEGSFEMVDMLSHGAEGIITRDLATKRLMRKGKDGKFVPIGEEDEETKNTLRAAHKCYNTGFQGDDKDCKNFMFECLLSQDTGALQACLARWASDSAKTGKSPFEIKVEDIKNLHPVLALRILQQFGFRKYRVHDETAGGQLYKVESVKHWLANYMKKQFSDEAIQKMFHDGKTNEILKYLDLVSQFVNANPAILNKDYSGSSNEAVGKQPVSEFARKLDLKAYIPVPARSSVAYDFNRLRGFLATKPMRSPFQVGLQGVTFPFGSTMTPGAGVGLLQGGGSKCDYVIKAFTQASGIAGSQLIKHYVESLIIDLKKKGKTLADTDAKKIQEHLAKLTEAETYLLRNLCYLDEYNRLLSVLGDYSSKTVTLNEVTACKFAERYNLLDGKYHNTENLLMEVIAKIQSMIGDTRKFEPINIEP